MVTALYKRTTKLRFRQFNWAMQKLETFMTAVSNELIETGFVEGFEHCHYRAQRGLRVDGFWFDDEGVLDLFVADFECRRGNWRL